MTSTDPRTIVLRQATVDDAPALTALASSTFTDTFGADNDPADMAAYLAATFSEARQRAELLDPQVTVLLAERDGGTIGYAMLREGDAPACVGSTGAIEIARLYARRDALGTGVGAALMRECLELARARGCRTAWLGVWEHNHRAIAFYERWHFEDVGMHHFQLGSDRQADRLMARALAGAR